MAASAEQRVTWLPVRYAYVVANKPATTHYTPDPAWSANSDGGPSSVTRDGTGRYTVRMPGLGTAAGNVQVTTYGAHTERRCKIASWAPSGHAMLVHVRCFAPSGARADAAFVAQFVIAATGPGPQSGYVSTPTASPPVGTPQALPGSYSYNSASGGNFFTRSAKGAYEVDFPDFVGVGGNVAVTAIGLSSTYCNVEEWGTTQVLVLCFDHTGAPANSRFSVRYTTASVAHRGDGAYVWADQPTAATYTPDASYSYNSAAAANIAHHIAKGVYSVVLRGLPSRNGSSAMVTSYGEAPTSCGVTHWSHDLDGGTAVRVSCHGAHGAPANSFYTLSYLANGG